MSCRVIGIDPAPAKRSVAYDGSEWLSWLPGELRDRVRHLEAPAIIAWDAPLSFDRADFYDRRVEKVIRAWVSANEKDGRFEKKAVGVRSFAGLSHWTVTCDALGMPFGEIPPRCKLSERPPADTSADITVIEVHPAVALGIWWLEKALSIPLPRYKGKARREGTRAIVEILGFPAEAGTDDDHLDACVAYRLGTLFRDGNAHWLGNPEVGGYVLPDSDVADDLRERYVKAEADRSRHEPLTAREWPTSVEEAVSRLIDDMSLQERKDVAAMNDEALILQNSPFGSGQGIRNAFGLWAGNTALLNSCGAFHPDDASLVILRALRDRLRR